MAQVGKVVGGVCDGVIRAAESFEAGGCVCLQNDAVCRTRAFALEASEEGSIAVAFAKRASVLVVAV